jgi:RsiW-degrading membrane proteinase PrsW (M82 family)
MILADIEISGFWAIPILLYVPFCFWMFCACVYREEERNERIFWAIMLFLFGAIAAPVYYFKRHRPQVKFRKQTTRANRL